LPTLPREPGQWLLPVWLAWPPIAVSVLVLGVGACVLSWIWAADSFSAAIVTQRLLRPDVSSRRKSLPDWVVPPAGGWMTTTSQHVAHWAVLLGGVEGDGKQPVHDVSAMLTRSLQIAPLNPTAKLALARLETPERGVAARPVSSLGLSRDAVSLAWSAGRLLDAGKKDAAIRLYGRALTAASTGGFSRTVTPRYDDDENSRRYLLPGEDAVRDIVNEMAARERDWTFREWSRALPQNPTVLLATARLLREKRRAEAEALVSLVIEGGGPSSTGHSVDPRTFAARAEALALGSRLKEAEQEYRQAIELADNDMIRRSWWFNLADIALRLNDETQRLVAIRAAIAIVPSDDITRRASSLQRASDSQPRGRFGSAN
jgi:tetratricopeptide (TPR) repeat protein